MKNLILTLICLLGLAGITYAQSVTLTIDAGLLENSTGTAVEPTGGLLQLIASPSGTFSAPTSSSYVSGDNVLVDSFSMSSTASGTAGETLTTTAYLLTTSSYMLATGETVELRFYPSLTLASMPTAPTLGTTYGQVRSNTVEFGGNIDPSETAWVIPASGAAKDLDYITMNDGGSYANATAYATNIVLIGMVPEPSTYMLFACAIGGLLILHACNRRSKALSLR